MKRLCALLLAALLLLSGCAAGRPDGGLPTLTVTFLDVGKADCILLEAEGRAAMIDAGNQGDAEEILALLSAKGISSLDFLLLTHLDKDHIGGADALIENVPIGTIYAPDYDKGNKQYDQYIAALTAAGIEPVPSDGARGPDPGPGADHAPARRAGGVRGVQRLLDLPGTALRPDLLPLCGRRGRNAPGGIPRLPRSAPL